MGNVKTEKNAFEVFAVFVKRLRSVLSLLSCEQLEFCW